MSLSLLLLHNHSGNTVVQDQKFQTNVTVKQHFDKWRVEYNVIYLGNYLGPEEMSNTCRKTIYVEMTARDLTAFIYDLSRNNNLYCSSK